MLVLTFLLIALLGITPVGGRPFGALSTDQIQRLKPLDNNSLKEEINTLKKDQQESTDFFVTTIKPVYPSKVTLNPSPKQTRLTNEQAITHETVSQAAGQDSNSVKNEEEKIMNDEERERYVALFYYALSKEKELRKLQHMSNTSLNIFQAETAAETEEMIRKMEKSLDEADKMNGKGQSIKQTRLPILLAFVLVAYQSWSRFP